MTDLIISTEDKIAITTKEVFLQDILDRIHSLGINKDKYFLARIMD